MYDIHKHIEYLHRGLAVSFTIITIGTFIMYIIAFSMQRGEKSNEYIVKDYIVDSNITTGKNILIYFNDKYIEVELHEDSVGKYIINNSSNTYIEDKKVVGKVIATKNKDKYYDKVVEYNKRILSNLRMINLSIAVVTLLLYCVYYNIDKIYGFNKFNTNESETD